MDNNDFSNLLKEWWDLYRKDNEEDDERVDELERQICSQLREPGGPPSCAIIDSKYNSEKTQIVVVPAWNSKGWFGLSTYYVRTKIKLHENDEKD